MPTSARKTDAVSRRALVAVATPVALAAVAGALALAGPANAAGTASALPFPTSICSTASPTSSSSASPSASASRSASASPQASASGSTKANAPKTASSASPSASSSTSPAAAGAAGPAASSPTPSASSSSSGGFWGWLNGVWTFIFGSAQVSNNGAAPAVNADYKVGPAKSGTVKSAAVQKAAAQTKTVTHSGTVTPNTAVQQAAAGAGAQASPSPTASCLPQSQIKANTATSDGNTAANLPWHLSAPSMTMYSLTYNGVTSIQTANGPEQVLDFTASKVTLVSMVTYSQQGGGKIQYIDGGKGQTVTLQNVHLWSTSFTADVLGLIHQTFTPQNPGLLTVLRGITIPLPLLFTNVEADNAFLNTGSIAIPGFDGHGN